MYFSSDGEESAKNPLVVDLETRDEQTQHKLNAWFGKVCSCSEVMFSNQYCVFVSFLGQKAECFECEEQMYRVFMVRVTDRYC